MAAGKRKDTKGRNLKKGESQMPDGRYRYRYTDKNGDRKAVYSWKLTAADKMPSDKKDDLSLREKIEVVKKDLKMGIDSSYANNVTLNEMFDRYMNMKINLKKTTKTNYIYIYEHFIKDTMGNTKIRSLKYSDIKTFYIDLLSRGIKMSTVNNINGILHPLFSMAVRDEIIRTDSTFGICTELRKVNKKSKGRHALTVEEQRLFITYLKGSEKFRHWAPLFIFFLGTGCRIGEVIGLTWNDIDFKNNRIFINHNMTYKPDGHHGMELVITSPKTEAGKRTIPLFQDVREALLQLKKDQFQNNIKCECKISGYSNFVFLNQKGNVYLPADINKAIKRIYEKANQWEIEQAKLENREPVQIRHFSAHNLRHTFCTRLCEVENNIKLIMTIMGHSDVQITMNIYSEIQESKKIEAYEKLDQKIMIV